MDHYTLGISAFYHDSAAALLKNGEIVAAVQEERFTRIKQDKRFPQLAIQFCLDRAGITIDQVNAITYYENPKKKFGRIVSTYFNFGMSAFSSFTSELPDWLFRKAHIRKQLNLALIQQFPNTSIPEIHLVDHHHSHAASAFYPSPFDEAAVLCVDGVGEWATTSAWMGKQNSLTKVWEIKFPHSLGLLYSAFTYFCGFKVDSGEYKLMGLAPYGKPIYAHLIKEHLIDIKPDGSFWLDMQYFDYATGNTMTSEKFNDLFGRAPREPEGELTQKDFDLAASVQYVIEEAILKLAQTVKKDTGAKNLCLAGGVALNCVSNGKLMNAGIFDRIWIQPASGDSGGALGSACVYWHELQGQSREKIQGKMNGSYWGSEYSADDVKSYLTEQQAVYQELDDSDLYSEVSNLLAEGNVIGWFQGRMEYGPRALGARSILGDPQNTNMQSTMNLKIKNRESFRPFAPAVMEEYANQWFDIQYPNEYMLFVVPVKREHRKEVPDNQKSLNGIDKLKCIRSTIPAVTHVDYTARVQTVSPATNERFYNLLSAFNERTGCPILVNTSFNVRGEPIVESPKDAYTCFMRTEMDYLVLGNILLKKTDQPHWNESVDWRNEFALD